MDLFIKTKYDTHKSKLENKILDTSGLVKKTNYNTKITKIEGKISDISNWSTKTALTSIENKIPDVSNLATKTALDTVENKVPDVNSLVKKQIITLELLRLILSYQALMVELLKISLLERTFYYIFGKYVVR